MLCAKSNNQTRLPNAKSEHDTANCYHHVFFIFVFIPIILPRLHGPHWTLTSQLPSNTSCTRSTFGKARALSLLAVSHLNLVCLPLQVLLVPALHAVHLWSPALRRTNKNLALAVSSAVRDADGLCGVCMRLGIGVVGRGGMERDSGFCGRRSIRGASSWLETFVCFCCH